MSIARILLGVVAALQTWFMVLEMLFWTKPLGLKAFGLTQEFAEQSKVLAMNQGLYNGFIAAGFIWALFHQDPIAYFQIALFFCACMFLAGVFGAATANWKIALVQALPAALTAAAVYFYW